MGRKRSKMYRASHRILLVGEGDFSFSLCLARRFGSAANMVATSLDSRGKLLTKYSKAGENLQELEYLGCTILHGIDVHTMSRRGSILGEEFDRIVFNFPHVGFHHSEDSARQIELHQRLVRGFLENAAKLLADCGQIFITHKNNHPYDQWVIDELAEDTGLYALPQVPFHLCDYPGYENKRGDGARCNKTFPAEPCSTFRFQMSEQSIDILQKEIDMLMKQLVNLPTKE